MKAVGFGFDGWGSLKAGAGREALGTKGAPGLQGHGGTVDGATTEGGDE